MTTRLLGTHVSTSGGVDQAPLRAKEIPVNTIQLFAKNNNQWLAKKSLSDEETESFLKNKKECGILCSFSHAGYLINLASPDPKNYALSLQSFAQELERASLLELDFVVIHPGAHVGQGMEAGIQKIAESFNRVLEEVSLKKTKVLIEGTAGQGTSIGSKLEELAAILEKVKNKKQMGVCLDTCHLFAAGYDWRLQENYEKFWKDFDSILGREQLCALHLNDSKGECGSHLDRHEHIGQGKLGLDGFRWMMQDKRLEKIPMALETPKEDDFVKCDRMNIAQLLSL